MRTITVRDADDYYAIDKVNGQFQLLRAKIAELQAEVEVRRRECAEKDARITELEEEVENLEAEVDGDDDVSGPKSPGLGAR